MAMQRSFAGGEIAASLYARADTAKYQTGLRTCRNFIVLRHGGVANRPGTKFLAEVKDSSKATYLLKFVFNATQTYVIEAGNLYFRFYRNGAQIVSGGSPYEIATPYVTADIPDLQFFQSADIVTIVHPSYDPRELARTSDTSWTLTTITFAPALAAPANPAGTAGGGSTLAYSYKVTAVASETYEESLPSAAAAVSCDQPSVNHPNQITWDAVAGAVEYYVYLDDDASGVYGFIGVASSNSFDDIGYIPDRSRTPPITRDPFSGADNRPSTGTYFQQRLVLAGSNNEPETAEASRTGFFKNFTIRSPIQDDDAVSWRNAGRQVNAIRHLIEAGPLFVLTAGGEWMIQGDEAGVLKPTSIHPRQLGHRGASSVRPVVIGDTILYVQARGSILRDLRYGMETEGYRGTDLSVFASHLFEGYTLTRMDYAEMPHSVVWSVRSDGTLLGMTYLPEHAVWGWHRHDTDGTFEDVAVVPESAEDAVYVIVNRTIAGATKRYVERLASRRVSDVKTDALFLDSFLTYDGRNLGATTMTASSAGGGWTPDDEITVTASAAYFASGDIGNAVAFLDDDDNEIVRIVITAFNSSTVVKGYPSRDVPATLRNVPTTAWAEAVDTLTGLSHLNAKTVSVLADGNVLPQKTVSSGVVTLDRPYSIIHAGLPITADLETLDLDIAGAEIRGRKKRIRTIQILVEASRGIFAGPDPDNLYELKPSTPADYDAPPALTTEMVEIDIASTWQESGRFVIRQTDPVPLTVLGVIPQGELGG